MTYQDMKSLLENLDNPVDRLEMVMDFGNSLQPIPADAVCSEIVGCASFVQICRKNNQFYATADSALVRGVVAIIVAMVDGKTPQEIKKIGLQEEFNSLHLNLGAGRLNGVGAMIRFLENL